MIIDLSKEMCIIFNAKDFVYATTTKEGGFVLKLRDCNKLTWKQLSDDNLELVLKKLRESGVMGPYR